MIYPLMKKIRKHGKMPVNEGGARVFNLIVKNDSK